MLQKVRIFLPFWFKSFIGGNKGGVEVEGIGLRRGGEEEEVVEIQPQLMLKAEML